MAGHEGRLRWTHHESSGAGAFRDAARHYDERVRPHVGDPQRAGPPRAFASTRSAAYDPEKMTTRRSETNGEHIRARVTHDGTQRRTRRTQAEGTARMDGGLVHRPAARNGDTVRPAGETAAVWGQGETKPTSRIGGTSLTASLLALRTSHSGRASGNDSNVQWEMFIRWVPGFPQALRRSRIASARTRVLDAHQHGQRDILIARPPPTSRPTVHAPPARRVARTGVN
ncbi:hypothetical protein JB92DRAFT_3263646 [Gautieria morchelliformis]|nr:hypothetical protein JB92DRAFT_3263646 [Gautieria morchelliformis]